MVFYKGCPSEYVYLVYWKEEELVTCFFSSFFAFVVKKVRLAAKVIVANMRSFLCKGGGDQVTVCLNQPAAFCNDR